MKVKRYVGIAIIVFALASLIYGLGGKPAAQNRDGTAEQSSASAEKTITVYFFFGDAECPTCDVIRNLTRRFLDGPLPEKAQGFTFKMKEINVEKPGNEEYIVKYSLVSTSIVLDFSPPGSEPVWRNLDKVWDLADDESAFNAYLESEIASFAEEVKGI